MEDSTQPAEVPKKKFKYKKLVKILLLVVVLFAIGFALKELFNLVENKAEQLIAKVKPLPSRIEYGIETNTFLVVEDTVKSGQTFAALLKKHGMPDSLLQKATNMADEHINLRRFMAGNPVMVLKQKKAPQRIQYIIYEHNFSEYLVLDARDTLKALLGKKPVEDVTSKFGCEIHSSVFGELEKKDINPEVAIRLSQIFAWTVDFHKIQDNDAFKVIFEEQKVEGRSVGINKVKAAWFKNKGQEFFAFPYEHNGSTGWYDEKGNSLKKMFLKAPLKFSRISSAFTMKRFHPVLKIFKAHLGTDYAASTGTPILAVGDGQVIDAKYNVNNGNYVKIKHNQTYTTQYLHMSRIAKGMRTGKRVKQGDVIGFVGSTGLATGPHLCFRFWKNGQQVDPKKEKGNMGGAPLESRYKSDFLAKASQLKKELGDI